MAIIGTVKVGSQPGQEALVPVPDMVLQLVDVRTLQGEHWRVIFWAWGDDFEAYEDALARNADVESYARLTETDGRVLYRITLSTEGERQTLHEVTVHEDITILRLTMTVEWATLTARFSSRAVLAAYREDCREQDMPFRLERLYEEESVVEDGDGSRYGVTEPQRQALVCALESGYFDVPRDTKLAAVAAELDISTSALSTRLRRGQRNLVRSTIAGDQGI